MRVIPRTASVSGVLLTVVLVRPMSAQAPDKAALNAIAGLMGIYEAVPSGTKLPSGMVTPAVNLTGLALLPAAAEEAKQRDLKKEPARMCQIVGPFRLMAREDTKIEFFLSPTPPVVYLIHEDISLGSRRQIFLGGGHGQQIPTDEPLWLGDSVGRWDGDSFVVDTIRFNEYTWLNERGAPHSEDLRVIERYRPILGGSYLEVTVTAEDPKVLANPFTYTRYYRKVTTEFREKICEPDLSNVSEQRHGPPGER